MYGLIDTSTLTDIADAIREKLGVQTTYKPSEMPEAIESISGGGITPTGTKSITANGTYDVASYASAEVNVPQSGITPTGTKQVSITSNGTTTEDVTAYASAQISVNVVNQDYEDALVALGVTEDLTDGIEALTTYANGVTGESDTTLSDAVASLADGYGQGGGSVKYSRYELTGDTTFRTLLETIQYAPQDTQNCMLFFRASGTVAPTTGSYTMNNYIFIIENGTAKGWNAYANGKVAPNSVNPFPMVSQAFNDLMITNGILTTNSTGVNCLGTTGDVVTIAEYPGNLALSLAKMNGGAL